MNCYINPNILNEGNQLLVLKLNNDSMKTIVRCNNCGQPTEYGKTRMISGFVGYDNKITINGKEIYCYENDLCPRVIKCHDAEEGTVERKMYQSGKLYRWRDEADGGL